MTASERSSKDRTEFLRALARLPAGTRADIRQRRQLLQVGLQAAILTFGTRLVASLIPIGLGIVIAVMMVQRDAFFTSPGWMWITIVVAVLALAAPLVVCALYLPEIRRRRQELATFEAAVQELIRSSERGE